MRRRSCIFTEHFNLLQELKRFDKSAEPGWLKRQGTKPHILRRHPDNVSCEAAIYVQSDEDLS